MGKNVSWITSQFRLWLSKWINTIQNYNVYLPNVFNVWQLFNMLFLLFIDKCFNHAISLKPLMFNAINKYFIYCSPFSCF